MRPAIRSLSRGRWVVERTTYRDRGRDVGEMTKQSSFVVQAQWSEGMPNRQDVDGYGTAEGAWRAVSVMQ